MKALESLILQTAKQTDATVKIDAPKIARIGLAIAKAHGVSPVDAVAHVMEAVWKGISTYEPTHNTTLETWIRTRILGEITHATDRSEASKIVGNAKELAMTGAGADEDGATVLTARDYATATPNPEQLCMLKQGYSAMEALCAPAERELMEALAEGKSAKSIAEATGVSFSLMARKTRNLRKKLGRSPKVRELMEVAQELALR